MPAAAARLLALAGEHDFAIIEDDALPRAAAARRQPAAAQTPRQRRRVLYCGTFAKAFSPAPRIGWLAASRHTETALLHKLMNTLSTSIPNQMAVASYLRDSRPDRRLAAARHPGQQPRAAGRHRVPAFPGRQRGEYPGRRVFLVGDAAARVRHLGPLSPRRWRLG